MSASTTAEAKPCSAVNVTVVLSVPQTSAQVAELPEHSVVHEVENTSVIGPGGDGGGGGKALHQNTQSAAPAAGKPQA